MCGCQGASPDYASNGFRLRHNPAMRPDTRTSSNFVYNSWPRLALQVVAATALASMLGGCAPSALSSARSQIAAGNYAAPHRQLVALAHDGEKLSGSERR